MSTLESIVRVIITSAGRGVTKKGFGVPLVVAKHTNFSERSKLYGMGTALLDMQTDGFTTNDPAYRAVQALGRNTPKPEKVVVGKLLTGFNQTATLTVKPIVALGGELYTINVTSPGGTATAVSYTASAADTETVIAAALDTDLNAIADLTSTPTAGVLALEADNASEVFLFNSLDLELFDFVDTTIDSNLVAEVTQIAATAPDWYGLYLADPSSAARITGLAAYVETLERIMLVTSHDTDNGNPVSTTSVMYLLNASQYFRTTVIYSGNQGAHAAATWLGEGFPFAPGSQTWAFKTLSGVLVDNLSDAFMGAIDAVKGNYYIDLGAGGSTQKDSTMASGEFIDVIRGRDWLSARLLERVFNLLKNARKIPYTNKGIDQVKNVVDAQLGEGEDAGYLSTDPLEGQETASHIVTAPDVSEVDPAVKATRLLPDVNFTAGLAGAVHAVQINGAIVV